jgi:hypothetical protein
VGWIFSGEHFYVYGGIALGTPSATHTFGFQNPTEGWNIAISGTLPNLIAIQIGTARCFTTCHYREYGVGLPPGLQLMVFYVKKVW